jgi:RNA chaperone Hfq
METNLLDRMLETYLAEQAAVTVTLQNKIRVSGKIKAFDSYIIVMEGQKWEILYRHAISSLTLLMQEERKRPSAASKPAAVKTTPPPKPIRTDLRKPKPAQPQALSSSSGESGLSNNMKDGLLKWMRDQKAAK